MIGIDGASWRLLDPLIAAGELPALARLKARGRFGTLHSTVVPESAIAWTSMRTGVGPGHHGVFKFTSALPQRPSYWKELERYDLVSLIVAVPKVSARERLRGVVIEGWTADPESDYVRPRALKPVLEAAGFDPSLEMTGRVAAYARRMALRTDALLALMAHEPWDHAFVVYEYGDTAAHKFRLDSSKWLAAQRAIDREIGRLVDAAGPDTTILIVSDHGWTSYRRSFDADAWLRQQGFTGWMTTLGAGSVVGIGPSPPDAPAGDPVARAADLAAMAQGLRALRDPSDGRPVVRRLLAPDQAFPGPLADAAPVDLLVELDPLYVAEFHKRRREVFRPGSFDQHAPDGIYLLAGPGIPAGPAADGSLFDVAPTALAFFGVAPPADLTGSPLVDFPTAPHRPAISGPAALEIEPAAPPSQDEAEALGRKLRALGYLE